MLNTNMNLPPSTVYELCTCPYADNAVDNQLVSDRYSIVNLIHV